MLSIVMTDQPHLQPFTDFLRHQTEYKFINKDQWMGFYRFNEEVRYMADAICCVACAVIYLTFELFCKVVCCLILLSAGTCPA